MAIVNDWEWEKNHFEAAEPEHRAGLEQQMANDNAFASMIQRGSAGVHWGEFDGKGTLDTVQRNRDGDLVMITETKGPGARTTTIHSGVASIKGMVAQIAVVPEMPLPLGEMPPTQRRIWRTAIQLAGQRAAYAQRLTAAMERYSPIFPPMFVDGMMWPSGDVEHVCDTHPDQNRAGCFGHTWYSQPIPEKALRAHAEARASGLFNRIIVFCPDRAAFSQSTPPMVRRFDPLMVGVVQQGFSNAGWDERYFLIAAWDLDKDIKFAEDVKLPEA